MSINMSLKIKIIPPHLIFFTQNEGDVNKHLERFHQKRTGTKENKAL